MLILRCSGLPLAFLCPGSVRRERLAIDESSEDARLGTAAHEGLAKLVASGRIDWDGVPELAKRHEVDEQALRGLLAQGQKLWASVRESFPNASTEQALEYAAPDGSFRLTGHADVIGASSDTLHVGDFKTGRLDNDHSEQIKGYAALALHRAAKLGATDVKRATAGVLWVRDEEYEHYTMPAEQMPAWFERLRSEVVDWDGTYRVGDHCKHCPRNHECPAGIALVRRDVAAIADNDTVARIEDENALAAMPADEIVSLLAKADLVVKYAERVRSAIRAHVMKHGEVTGSEKKLVLQQEERRGLETVSAFQILEQRGFEDPEWSEVIDISLAKAERIAAQKAGKGNGAAAVRELRVALDEAGAIKVSTITKLVVRRA